MERTDHRQGLYQGYGDTLARAFELVVTPLVLGFLGHLADSRLGTAPLLTIALGAFGVVGMFVKLWLGYVAAMKAEEEAAPWRKP